MDRESWRAADHGVAKRLNWTELSMCNNLPLCYKWLVFVPVVPIVSRENKAGKAKIILKEIYLRLGFHPIVFLAHHLITPHCLFSFIAPVLKHLFCDFVLCWCHAFSQLCTTLPPLLGLPFVSVSIWQTPVSQPPPQCSVMPVYLADAWVSEPVSCSSWLSNSDALA